MFESNLLVQCQNDYAILAQGSRSSAAFFADQLVAVADQKIQQRGAAMASARSVFSAQRLGGAQEKGTKSGRGKNVERRLGAGRHSFTRCADFLFCTALTSEIEQDFV